MARKIVNNEKIFIGGVDVSNIVQSVGVKYKAGNMVVTTVVFLADPRIVQGGDTREFHLFEADGPTKWIAPKAGDRVEVISASWPSYEGFVGARGTVVDQKDQSDHVASVNQGFILVRPDTPVEGYMDTWLLGDNQVRVIPPLKVGDAVTLTPKHYLYKEGADNTGVIAQVGGYAGSCRYSVDTIRRVNGSSAFTTNAGDAEVEAL